MALYLGSEMVSLTVVKESNTTTTSGINYATGTVISDENGVVTFPKLGFTPTMITVWNVVRLEQDTSEDILVECLHTGVMLMAINQNGSWISQGLGMGSSEIYITNETATGGIYDESDEGHLLQESYSGVSINNGVYSYQLCRYAKDAAAGDDTYHDITNVEFNYAIYG